MTTRRLPRPKVYASECFDGAGFGRNHRDAHRIVCPGCHADHFVNCNSTHSEVMDLARSHFERCRPLFDLRCRMVPMFPDLESLGR